MTLTLIIGAKGQLGGAICRLLGPKCVSVDRAQADLSNPESLLPILEKAKPAAIINAAAYTQVDKAETEQEQTFIINAVVPGMLAEWCAARQIPFVHYSTDYVFDGSGTK